MLTDETNSLIRVVHEKLTVAYLVQEGPPRPLWTRIFMTIHSSLLVDPILSQRNPVLNSHTLVV